MKGSEMGFLLSAFSKALLCCGAQLLMITYHNLRQCLDRTENVKNRLPGWGQFPCCSPRKLPEQEGSRKSCGKARGPRKEPTPLASGEHRPFHRWYIVRLFLPILAPNMPEADIGHRWSRLANQREGWHQHSKKLWTLVPSLRRRPLRRRDGYVVSASAEPSEAVRGAGSERTQARALKLCFRTCVLRNGSRLSFFFLTPLKICPF